MPPSSFVTSSNRETNFERSAPLVVGLGEGLFDCIGNRQTLGGAPINFVVHLQAVLRTLSATAVPVTRVGTDHLGTRLIADLANRGIDIQFIQLDPEFPTGTVQVRLNASGEPQYVFPANVAWDFLSSTDELASLAHRCQAVCFGTLAQRTNHSHQTIVRFLADAKRAFRLLDVNLRQQFYQASVLHESCRLANAVKLNEYELDVVCELLGLTEPARTTILHRANRLRRHCELDWVAVTRGADGITFCSQAESFEKRPPCLPRSVDADSIGAGDACCAGLMCGSLLKWPALRMVEYANQLGAYVASQPGATPILPDSLLNLAS